jgi:hypothetical protein
MTGLDIRVEENLFRAVGVQVNVDVPLYDQLLDELSAGVNQPTSPTVHLFPELSWLKKRAHVTPETMKTVYGSATSTGNYDPKGHVASIACPQAIGEANKAILQVTKFWSQDVNGEVATVQKRLNIGLGAAAVGFAGGVAGLATGIYLKNPDIIVGSAYAMVMSPAAIAWYKMVGNKNARHAYKFQRNPQVLAQYGRIISYHALKDAA